MWIVYLLLGILIGSALTFIFYRLTSARGTLKIDRENPERDNYLFIVDNIDELSKKKRVILDIKNLSQK